MRIRPMSDLHTEFMPPEERFRFADGIIDGLREDMIDVLVLAGDIGSLWAPFPSLREFLTYLCRRAFFELSVRTWYVPGNHEYFGEAGRGRAPDFRAKTSKTEAVINSIMDDLRVHGLFRLSRLGPEKYGTKTFLGATLWYPWNQGVARIARGGWPDQRLTEDPRGDRWASEEGAADADFLARETRPGDIVVTHMLPHKKSVAAAWVGAATNLMFVHPMGKTIETKRPALWIHGHTHDSCDYTHEGTRIVCNPYGYFGHALNPKFDPRLVIEV